MSTQVIKESPKKVVETLTGGATDADRKKIEH
jgi:hypothetical protein